MIILEQVTAVASETTKTKTVLSCTDLTIPSDRRIALLGPSEDDKKIVIELLAGALLPAAGRIFRKARVSFPVGQLGGFTNELTVRINVAHVARLYGADVQAVVDFVERFSELGRSFDKPFGDLPRDMKRRLSHIVAYSIPFDIYLLNREITRRRKSRDRSYALFEARARTCGMIVPTRNSGFARECCDMALLLDNGKLLLFEDIDEALATSHELWSVARSRRNRSRLIPELTAEPEAG